MEQKGRGERMVLVESWEKREFEVGRERKEKLDHQGQRDSRESQDTWDKREIVA